MIIRGGSIRFSLVVIASLVLSGCGGSESGTGSTQVVAKVNGSEISVHQLNAVLGSVRVSSQAEADQARENALAKLVEQQLAYDQALEEGLDRTPETVMAIENARREIIASAYLKQLAAGLSKPSQQAVKKYYNDNPALFSQRKVFRLQELAVEPKAELLPSLEKFVAKAENLEQVADWLKQQKIRYRPSAATKAAEQISLDLLGKVSPLGAGEMLVLSGEKNFLVIRVVQTQSAPVTLEQATPRIATFLQNLSVKELLEAAIAEMKESAEIEYLGDYAASPDAVTETSTQEESMEVAASSESDSVLSTEQDIENGLKGLN